LNEHIDYRLRQSIILVLSESHAGVVIKRGTGNFYPTSETPGYPIMQLYMFLPLLVSDQQGGLLQRLSRNPFADQARTVETF